MNILTPSKLVHHYEMVQQIPYKICRYNPELVDEYIKKGDCRHKTELLRQILVEQGFKVKKLKAVFDWKDLPISQFVLNPLKKNTIWDHDLLAVYIKGKWIKVDCAWPPEFETKGFPVTSHWDGESDTMQVTTGNILFFDAENYKRTIKIDIGDAREFVERFNEWISS